MSARKFSAMTKRRVTDHHAHHQRVVAVERALHEIAADAGQAENLLHHQRAGENAGQRRAQITDQRQRGRAQGMAQHDAVRGQALGAGGADIVGVQHFDHAAAHQPRDDGDLRQGQHGHRQDHVAQRAAVPAAHRQEPMPRQLDAEAAGSGSAR